LGDKSDFDRAAARDAVADLQNRPFSGARQAVEVARFILAGETAPASSADPPADPSQATRVPSSDTVQNPAGE
jgi:hypothetical protein